MRRPLTLLTAVLLLAPTLAQAKSWKGVTPGATQASEITKRFGEPTKRLKAGKKHVLAYEEDEAIEGAKQAQFIVGEDGLIEQIAVFPESAVDKVAIETTFGPSCAEKPGVNCFVKKVNDDDFKTYDWYAGLGLVVFFGKDGHTVESFLYVKPSKTGEQQASSKPQPQQASGQAPRTAPAK